MFEYKVRSKHKLGFKEFKLYATTDIEEFFNRNNIEYVRNVTDTVEHRLFKEIERLNNKVEELMTLYTTEKNVKDDYKAIINELEKWLVEEQDRLARETSNIYEDSLGKTRLVNEIIYIFQCFILSI